MIARILLWACALFLLAVGGVLLAGGVRLVSLGGSPYYALAGAALVAVAILLARGGPWGPRLFALALGATIVWSVIEAGLDGWALLPRLVALSVIGLWLIAPWTRAALYHGRPAAPWLSADGPLALAVLAAAGVVAAGAMHGYPVQAFPERPRLELGESVADWRNYGGTPGGTRYAQLDQITPENAGDLEEVWRYRTGVTGTFKNTPLQVGALLYLCTNRNVLIALDAETGTEVWRHDPGIQPPGAGSFGETCRGVSYHEAAAGTPAGGARTCAARIITGTTDAQLIAVDALTGERCAGFGRGGAVDLAAGMGEFPPSAYFVTSPPLIAGNVAVVGGWVADAQMPNMPSGVLRAFDVTTGALAWAWDLGRPGVHTAPPLGETYTLGTPNVWSVTSYDPELGLIYAPTGNAGPDYYGPERSAESEAYASSIVALDAATGEPRWSFQTVHHDIWDYDVPSQPVLVDLPQPDGSILPALAAPTKRGEIFLLDRRSGAPIAAVEERPVPQGAVEGDWTAPTQPFSAEMPHFRPDIRERDMWGITPLDQLWCRITFRTLRYEGHFTPPVVGGSLQFPGNAGGFNWGSVSVDPERGLLVAAPMLLANRVDMIESESGPPFRAASRPFLSPILVPCLEPPYSRIAVIDLQTRELLWSRPFGSARETGPFGMRSGLDINVGVPAYAGSIVTRGGVIFHGASMDRSIRAFDVRNGKVLWRANLPGSAHATPMSYRAPRSGRQMVVITVPSPSWRYPRGIGPVLEGDEAGGYVIAYALPEG
jgi:membrane-bound PQQ-dependent dehydrogenase (glucose/quinate/shikimate family)